MPEMTTVQGPLTVLGPLKSASVLNTASTPGMTVTFRKRYTTAEVNAGQTLIAAASGIKWRLVDFTLVAVGGSASGASVRIAGTQSSSTVQLVTAANTALSQGTWVKPNSANVTMLADAASANACDVNTAITLNASATLATATHVDVSITVQGEAA